MIRHKSFGHGWWYHYRLHEENAAKQCNNGLQPLSHYLHGLFDHCPDEKFLVGPRCSRLRFPLDVDAVRVRHHPVSQVAKLAGDRWSGHTEVELALLNHDARTVAAEVPLWLDPEEHELMSLVRESGSLTGHIDVLRVEEGNVWVWDYKPGAAKERFAATQILAYAVMLSQRTGLPLSRFRCGWFDEKEAFVFDPGQMRRFR
jgi:hypothetical protein